MGTTLHVLIANLTSAAGADVLALTDARNVTIQDATIESAGTGIRIVASADVAVLRSTIKSSAVGVDLVGATRVTLRDNRLALNDQDVRLERAEGNVLRNNNLSIATGQTGIHFADDASWRNDVDATNVVNSVPIRWLSGVGGRPGHPLVLRDAQVELRGMTNAGQIILHDVRHVELERPVAKDGAGDGIAVRGAFNLTIRDAVAEGNAGDGIFASDARGLLVRGGAMRGNGGNGLHAVGGADLRVERANATGNDGSGVGVAGVAGVALAGNTASGNGVDGLHVAGSSDVALDGNTLRANQRAALRAEAPERFSARGNVAADSGETGLWLVGARRPVVHDNSVTGGAKGIRLDDTSGGEFRRNRLSPGAGGHGIFFDGAASYGNSIDASNLVLGERVRWYTNLSGTAQEPVVIRDAHVEAPRVTNVAQVMIYESRHVRLENAIIANGSAEGLLVLDSHNVTLNASALRGNNGRGALVAASPDFRVEDTVVRRNGGHGLELLRSPRPQVEHNGFVLNGGDGLLVAESAGASLTRVTADRNGGRGVVVADGPGAPTALTNTTATGNLEGGILVGHTNLSAVDVARVEANGPFGLRLDAIRGPFRVANLTLVNHSSAVELTSTRFGRFDDSRVVAAQDQIGFRFDGPLSYDNAIATSNTFNGEPVRWHTHLDGTAEAPVHLGNFTAAARGVTNVAQVMVYASRNVTLHRVQALDGVEHGLVVYASENVTLHRPVIVNNSRDGLRVEYSSAVVATLPEAVKNGGTGVQGIASRNLAIAGGRLAVNKEFGAAFEASSVTLRGTVARENAEGGIAIRHHAASPAVLENVTVAQNGGAGLILEDAPVGRVDGLTSEMNAGAGVKATRGANGTLSNLTVRDNAGGGVLLELAGVETVEHSEIARNGEHGLAVSGGTASFVAKDNRISHHARGIRLEGTTDARFERNAIVAAPRQVGFHFADVASYDNRIATSNTVNGHAVQWHVRPENATIGPVRVELPGITNVAQLMIYRGSNVTLDRASVSDGAADGIVVYASTNVTLASPSATGNRGFGVAIAEGSAARVNGGEMTKNRAGGVIVAGGAGVSIENATIGGNRGAGVRVGKSALAEIASNVIRDNVGDGIRISDSAAIVRDNRVEANDGAGIHLQSPAARAHVARNAVLDHPQGIRLARTQLAEFEDNHLSILDGQTGFHFDDAESYNNLIPPSNLVNGVAMRWHVGLSGTETAPVELEDVRVELRGITNVAQVMLSRSAYVSMPDAIAANGTARGIYVHRSSSIVIDNATVEGNDVGVHLDASQSSHLWNASARGARIGVELTNSGNNVVAHVDASGAQTGVRLDADSRGNRVFGTVAHRVSEASVSDPSVAGILGNSLLVDAGRDMRAGVGRTVAFDEAIVTSRFDSERIVHQRWEFGDGGSAERATGSPFRPTHAYGATGDYVVTLRIRTADGREYVDSATVRVVGPLTPAEGVRAVQGLGVVSLTWAPPASDGGSPIESYRIYRGDAPGNASFHTQVPGVTAHFDREDVQPGVLRYYAVTAVTADGEGPLSNWTRAENGSVPDAPAGLRADAGASNVTLEWREPEDTGGLPVDSYRIYRSSGDEEPILAGEVVATTRFVDAAVVPDREYQYRVTAHNSLGESRPSAVAAALPTRVPEAPSNLTALSGDGSATLFWSAPATHPTAPILHYRVYRGSTLTDQVRVAQVYEAKYRDEGLSNVEDYAYSVSAVTRAGEGPRSALAHAAPVPVDLVAPVVLRVAPADGALVTEVRPTFRAEFVDNTLAVEATLLHDGREVARTRGSQDHVSWRPGEGLPYGVHTLTVRVRDAAGHANETTWSVRLLSPDEQKPQLAWLNLTLGGQELALGDATNATVRVRNVGWVGANVTAELTLSGVHVASQPLALAPGEETNVTFDVEPSQAGEFLVRIGDSEPQPLLVVALDEEPPQEEEPLVANDTPPEPAGGFLGIPAPGVAALLAAALGGALAARRGARR